MLREKLSDSLRRDLIKAGISADTARRCARAAAELGWRKPCHGEWIRDVSYTGKSKKVYHCSLCGHWQTGRRYSFDDNLFYMQFCPYCGAQMRVRDEKGAEEGEGMAQ